MVSPTSLVDTRVVRFSPAGLSDSLDCTDEYPGACAILQNLIPDPTTKNMWIGRPASILIYDTTPKVNIPIFVVVGNFAYGLSSNGTNDVPFAYNLSTNSVVTVTNTGQNPTSLTTTGDWIPPTQALCGTNLVITHPGFSGANYFGWFDLTNPAAPVWNSGNTAGGSAFSFTTIPTWVAQYNGRACWGNNPATGQPGVIMSDALTLKVTNASQVITFGDNLFLNFGFGLGLNNQLGGIINSLMVFKVSSDIYQVTGDFSTSNLSINKLSVSTGTNSPLAVCSTPLGLFFISPFGARLIDQNAAISEVIGAYGTGVSLPFITAISPTRMCAYCDGTTIRVSLKSGLLANNPWVEYWYSIPLKYWSGPHTFPATYYQVYQGNFVIVPQSHKSAIFNSGTVPTSTSSSTEDGVQMAWIMQSCMLEDNQSMAESEVAEMQYVCGGGATGSMLNIVLQDSNNSAIQQSTLNTNSGSTLWGTGIWGTSIWGGPQGIYPYRIDFPPSTVFNRVAIRSTANTQVGFRIGDTYMRVRTLGYVIS